MSIPRRTKVAITAVATLIAIIVFGIWLYQARANANRSLDWPGVPATVVRHDDAVDHRNRVNQITTTVAYSYQGKDFEKTLSIYELDDIEVFVNPENPEEIRAERGVSLMDVAFPLGGLILSGLVAAFLVAVCFSPSDDE